MFTTVDYLFEEWIVAVSASYAHEFALIETPVYLECNDSVTLHSDTMWLYCTVTALRIMQCTPFNPVSYTHLTLPTKRIV